MPVPLARSTEARNGVSLDPPRGPPAPVRAANGRHAKPKSFLLCGAVPLRGRLLRACVGDRPDRSWSSECGALAHQMPGLDYSACLTGHSTGPAFGRPVNANVGLPRRGKHAQVVSSHLVHQLRGPPALRLAADGRRFLIRAQRRWRAPGGHDSCLRSLAPILLWSSSHC